MKRFLITSAMLIILLVIGDNAQAEEINQEYSTVLRTVKAANLDTRIHLGEKLNLEIEKLLEQRERDKITTKEDCVLGEEIEISYIKSESNIDYYICKKDKIFIEINELADLINYSVETNIEEFKIELIKEFKEIEKFVFDGSADYWKEVSRQDKYNKDKEKELVRREKEKIEINIDGTEGFIGKGKIYIPLKSVIGDYKLDYSIDLDKNSLVIMDRLDSTDIIDVEDVTMYSVMNFLYTEYGVNEDKQYGTVFRNASIGRYDKKARKKLDDIAEGVTNVVDGLFTKTRRSSGNHSGDIITGEGKIFFWIEDYEITEEEQKELDRYVEKIKRKIEKEGLKTDEEKVKFLNREIRELTRYDYNYKDEDLYGSNSLLNTPYGAITKGKSVCQGYANTFTLLAEELEIPVIKVRGYSKRTKEYHVWNVVHVEKNGELGWYHVDVTWNDTGGGYKHLLSSETFERRHKNWSSEEEQVTKDIKYKDLKLDLLINKSLSIIK